MVGIEWFVIGFNAPPEVSSGSCALRRPMRVGMEGPKMSRSRIPTLNLLEARETARFVATVLLPTPPLQLETATTCLTCGILRGETGPVLRGSSGAFGVFVGRPYLVISMSEK